MFPSVIIPVYRRYEWLVKCLKALNNQQFNGNFEIVVVDDGSPNEKEIKDSIKTVRFNSKISFKYIRQDNRGPATARNTGIRNSSGDILCFLDDDSIAEPTWLENIIKPIVETKADFVSGKILSYFKDIKLPVLLEKTVYNGKSWATCNIAYKREIIEKLGGFDETFQEPSWEDNDLALRAIWSGFKHSYNPEAIVYHPHERTFQEYKMKCLLNGRGAAHFSRKYLLSKPLWSFITPVVMSRRLLYFFTPPVLLKKKYTVSYVKFLWSYYSLKGFLQEVFKRHGKDQKG